jgi:hypothetical protein
MNGFVDLNETHVSCVHIIASTVYELVVRVSGYSRRGPGFDAQRYQIF